MTCDWANVIGLIGSAIFIAAFAYANAAPTLDKVRFNIANLIGAVLLLASLWVHFNLAAFVHEVACAAIAAWGLLKALRERRRGSAT